jgi:predicted  nucleic acid-binding Zn-ribbon protein
MTDKKPTVAALQRKIERLEARLAEADAKLAKHFEVYRESMYEAVDAKTKIKQALEILQGES